MICRTILATLLALVFCSDLLADNPGGQQPIAPEVAQLTNLVENPGFEQGGTLPTWWSRHPAKDADGYRLLRDTTVAHSGTSSGLIVGTPLASGQPSPNLQWNKYGIPVEGGSALILSCYVKTEETSPAHVGCHFYDENRKHLGFHGVPFPKSDAEWVYLRDRVIVPDGARQMGFVLYTHSTGKTWYDDVAVLGTPSIAAVRGTPNIDGRLDDACWQSGSVATQFAVTTGAQLAAVPTEARIAYDDEALTVAFRCSNPSESATAEANRHDDRAQLDDSVEILLDPNRNRRDFFRITVNGSGQIRDTRISDPAWKSAARVAVDRTEEAWTVEVRIPYDHLGIDLSTGTKWGINLARNDHITSEMSVWSLGGLDDARRFGTMTLSPDLWRFRRESFARQLAHHEDEVARLRTAMRDAGMSVRSMAEPEQMLKAAEEKIRLLRRQIDATQSDDPAVLAELHEALARLAHVVPEARGTATQFMFTTAKEDGGGFRVAVAHSLQKVPRDGPWRGGMFANRVELEAAGDEAESFQLVVIPAGSSLESVNVEAPPLVGPGGQIPIAWHRVDYVETVEPKYPTSYVGWWPDPLLPPGPINVEVGRRQPLWFRVSVPPDATPGRYTGQVTIRYGDDRVTVPVELRVRNFRLPRPGTLATAFGNYAFAISEAYYGKGDYRQKLAVEDYARWCEFMAQYRLGPKNSPREYTTVTRDGARWQADLSPLSKTVQPFAAKYYAPHSLGLDRLPSGPNLEKPDYHPDPADWARRARAIADAWARLGLPPAYIYGVDEPRPQWYPFLRQAYDQIHTRVPEHPIMQTVNQSEPVELAGAVDIWCPLTSRLEADFYAERRKAGDTLWAYVCCGPIYPYANFFIDRPATEHRVVFWQIREAGATGFLYWCVCWWQGLPTPAVKPSWPDVPIRMQDHAASAPRKVNGDGLLLYPGPDMQPYPSIRLEVILDGIEDYEYLALLARLVDEAKRRPAAERPKPEVLAEADRLCRVPKTISRSMTEYTDDPVELFARRKAVGDMIERLSANP